MSYYIIKCVVKMFSVVIRLQRSGTWHKYFRQKQSVLSNICVAGMQLHKYNYPYTWMLCLNCLLEIFHFIFHYFSSTVVTKHYGVCHLTVTALHM